MTSKPILFPTDLSDRSNTAFDVATSLARDMDARLLIVHVDQPPESYTQWCCRALDPERVELLTALKEVVPGDHDVRFEHRLVTARPATGILELAQEEDAAMIVMSTHGRGGLSRLVLGSVAEAVLREATCPVLTIKDQDPVDGSGHSKHGEAASHNG